MSKLSGVAAEIGKVDSKPEFFAESFGNNDARSNAEGVCDVGKTETLKEVGAIRKVQTLMFDQG